MCTRSGRGQNRKCTREETKMTFKWQFNSNWRDVHSKNTNSQSSVGWNCLLRLKITAFEHHQTGRARSQAWSGDHALLAASCCIIVNVVHVRLRMCQYASNEQPRPITLPAFCMRLYEQEVSTAKAGSKHAEHARPAAQAAWCLPRNGDQGHRSVCGSGTSIHYPRVMYIPGDASISVLYRSALLRNSGVARVWR